MPRTQRLSLGLLHEITEGVLDTNGNKQFGEVKMMRADTKQQKGDLFTKYLKRSDLQHVLGLINVLCNWKRPEQAKK